MKKKKSKSSIKTKLIIAGVLVILSYVIFWGEYNFYELYQLNRQNQKLIEEIQATEMARDSLHKEIEKLKNDSSYIEKIAREQYLMGKQDEKIYIIETDNE